MAKTICGPTAKPSAYGRPGKKPVSGPNFSRRRNTKGGPPEQAIITGYLGSRVGQSNDGLEKSRNFFVALHSRFALLFRARGSHILGTPCRRGAKQTPRTGVLVFAVFRFVSEAAGAFGTEALEAKPLAPAQGATSANFNEV